ncbi:MAG: RNA polymerase sigma factor [Solirubrobacteraceae bacterium]|jgi:RNA polymerase sigma-70 factor, ECF subfamily
MPSEPTAVAGEDEAELLQGLRRGDEGAFAALMASYNAALLHVATSYVSSRAVAEEVVQDTWLGVVKGLDRFEGRSSLKTWIFKILTNTARTRGTRERRSVPFSSLAAEPEEGPTLDPDRFFAPDHNRYPGHWSMGPAAWKTPEGGLLAAETKDIIVSAIERLPAAQRTVIALRDVEGWPPEDVCQALDLSQGNQRVLLHRARTKVRAELERHFGAVEATVSQ